MLEFIGREGNYQDYLEQVLNLGFFGLNNWSQLGPWILALVVSQFGSFFLAPLHAYSSGRVTAYMCTICYSVKKIQWNFVTK